MQSHTRDESGGVLYFFSTNCGRTLYKAEAGGVWNGGSGRARGLSISREMSVHFE